ncbi:HAUS augmin-like complex subunit 1 isoform X2 [Ahaetulla prasina]|uniref:HAUS augmin-like complex subunit 1 isoform X2 n=1 Tax=Ahaetulla prasina TaxID=499056 RepID=UPI002649D5ED|nr:HAUS augmin-like complex subunit 1 isoform X2 [Ahaetulla prasina]
MEEKLSKVTSWLKNVFGEQPIPPFEVNARTVDILYELAECNESRDGDVNLLIEDMKQKAVEYESDGLFLQELLMESLNLSLSSLSKASTSYLNNLVDIALALETKDTSLASDVLKAEKFLIEERKTADHRMKNMEFLMKKSEDIKCEIRSVKDQLSESGLDASLTHESLVTLSEKLADLKNQSVPLKKKIKSYLDLTPSPSLARVKIEEAKRELEALEAEFSTKLDMTALSVTLPTKRPFV